MNRCTATLITGLLSLASVTYGGDVVRNSASGVSAELTSGTAWDGGIAPGSGDVAVWTTGSRTGGSTNNQLNNNASWQGIRMEAVGGAVTLNGSGTLELGSAGIDLSAATGNLTFTIPVLKLTASQEWSSNAAGQLTLSGSQIDLGNAARTISISNPDAASTTNKIAVGGISGGPSASLKFTNANIGSSPQVWVQLFGTGGTGIQTDLTIGSGVLAYYGQAASLAATSNLTVEEGGVFDVSLKANSAVTQTVASLSGAGTITSNRPGNNTTLIVNSSGISTFSGSFVNGTGAINLTKDGGGILVLDGTSTTSGPVTVSDGVLRLNSAGALSSNANLTLGGGIVELGAGNSTFSRVLGGLAGQVRLTGGDGPRGFGAVGADATVNLGAAEWGSGNFNPGGQVLALSSDTSTHQVTFLSEINLGRIGDPTRTIEVRNGSASIDAEISGVIRNHSINNVGSIIKSGTGTLVLSASNTYTGTTTVDAGTLILTGSLDSASAVTVNSGGKFAAGDGIDFANEITVNSGGKIGGEGTYSDPTGITLVSGAIVAPGNSPGNTFFNTDLTLESDAVFEWELGSYGTNAGVDSDLLTITGAGNVLTFDSGSILTLNFLSPVLNPNSAGEGGFWLSDQQWLIAVTANGGTIVDNGLMIQAPVSFANGSFWISSEGGDLYLNYGVIPEPGTAMLFGIGLLMAGVCGFRCRRA